MPGPLLYPLIDPFLEIVVTVEFVFEVTLDPDDAEIEIEFDEGVWNTEATFEVDELEVLDELELRESMDPVSETDFLWVFLNVDLCGSL